MKSQMEKKSPELCPWEEEKDETLGFQTISSLDQDHGGTKEGGNGHNKTADNGRQSHLRSAETSGGTLGAGGRTAGAAAGRGTSGVRAARARARGSSAGGSGTTSAGVLAAGTAETNTLTGTLGHVLLGGIGDSRKSVSAVDVPGGGLLGRARVGTTGLVVATVTLGVGGLLESRLQGSEVRTLSDAVTVDGDQAIVATLVGVLVNETTRVDGCHLGRVQRTDFLELTLVGVATVLREEERQAVVGERLDLLRPTRLSERGGVTPRVVVEGEEAAALIVGTAVHVLSHLKTVSVDIGLWISHVSVVLGGLIEIFSFVTPHTAE